MRNLAGFRNVVLQATLGSKVALILPSCGAISQLMYAALTGESHASLAQAALRKVFTCDLAG